MPLEGAVQEGACSLPPSRSASRRGRRVGELDPGADRADVGVVESSPLGRATETPACSLRRAGGEDRVDRGMAEAVDAAGQPEREPGRVGQVAQLATWKWLRSAAPLRRR